MLFEGDTVQSNSPQKAVSVGVIAPTRGLSPGRFLKDANQRLTCGCNCLSIEVAGGLKQHQLPVSDQEGHCGTGRRDTEAGAG